EASVQPLLDAVPHDENRAVRVVDLLLREALRRAASDLHLECKRDVVLAKLRVDGQLHLAARIDRSMRDSLLTRLKVMAELVIYQTMTPQDGRIEIEWEGGQIQCRVAFLPTLHGEKVVVRLPERSQAEMELSDLGMGHEMLERVEQLVRRSQGAIFLTGPSSSGKTTTIYAMLKAIWRLRGEAANIATLEDPIEADLGVVSQTQVRPHQGMTFEQGLRTLLRQDPDVMMIGEVRDATTAQIAVQAALTGHLVISTVHSGRASGVFVRLVNMGVEPFLVASSVMAVIAQRLVRRLCPECRKMATGPSPLLEELDRWWEPQGCAACDNIGYRGRVGVFEMLEVDEAIRELVMARAPESRFHDLLREIGAGDLAQDAAAKVAAGMTSPEEILACLA
ncbi:MAG TPA: GspE/PulE family protein, partial [Sumerlaeia bacterium]|nr:GspE/PulE family protein [Sumerlaeia bacterium]